MSPPGDSDGQQPSMAHVGQKELFWPLALVTAVDCPGSTSSGILLPYVDLYGKGIAYDDVAIGKIFKADVGVAGSYIGGAGNGERYSRLFQWTIG